MYQNNYGYYNQQPRTTSMYTAAGLKGRPVASFEEVRASAIDFDGSIFYFPDLTNRRIYTKQINPDGTVSMNLYELREMPQAEPVAIDTSMYITREEFEKVIAELRAVAQSQPVAVTAPPQTDYKF